MKFNIKYISIVKYMYSNGNEGLEACFNDEIPDYHCEYNIEWRGTPEQAINICDELFVEHHGPQYHKTEDSVFNLKTIVVAGLISKMPR